MPGWGLQQNETFTGTLTANFNDNKKTAYLKQTDSIVIYVDYQKGDEDELQLQASMSFHDDGPDPVAKEAVVENSTGLVTPFIHRFTESDKLRIIIPISPQENEVEVSVRGLNGTPTGTFTITWNTNSHRYT